MHLIRYFLIILCLPAIGQVSQLGRYSADNIRGCAPLTINLTVRDTFGNITRQYFYENENDVTTSQTHEYITSGIYNLVQLIGIDVDPEPKTDTLVIEVLASTIPVYDYLFCDSREVYLEITDPTYDSYEVQFGSGGPITLLEGESTSYVFGAAESLSIDVRGIYSNAADNCNPSSIVLNQVFDNLIAPDVSTVSIIQSCEDFFNLSITTNEEPEVLYEIEMNTSGGAYTDIYNGFISSPMLLENISIDENETEYCVRINAVNACNGSLIIGNPTCVALATGDLNPVRNLYSSYAGNQIQLFLDPATIGSFVFQRSFDQQSYSTLGQGQSDYTDQNPFFGRQYFYRVSYMDTCSATWNEQATSPPFIKAEQTSINNYQITLDQAEHQTGEIFTYIAQLSGGGSSEATPISSNTFEIGLSPNLGEKQALQIIGTSQNLTVQSNTMNFAFEFIVYVPKAFTPDGDGLNDRLEFFGLDGSTAILNIYSRWGQQVYGEISTAPAWDGLINGSLADEGIYVYEISIPEIANHVQKGTFALIKK
ncbi:MAG: T9SS type B sorting domain-containing protein [Cytophagales bacterium]|nr:T9SS type B sorting domain-containing protein [Cytophagales bacterium]